MSSSIYYHVHDLRREQGGFHHPHQEVVGSATVGAFSLTMSEADDELGPTTASSHDHDPVPITTIEGERGGGRSSFYPAATTRIPALSLSSQQERLARRRSRRRSHDRKRNNNNNNARPQGHQLRSTSSGSGSGSGSCEATSGSNKPIKTSKRRNRTKRKKKKGGRGGGGIALPVPPQHHRHHQYSHVIPASFEEEEEEAERRRHHLYYNLYDHHCANEEDEQEYETQPQVLLWHSNATNTTRRQRSRASSSSTGGSSHNKDKPPAEERNAASSSDHIFRRHVDGDYDCQPIKRQGPSSCSDDLEQHLQQQQQQRQQPTILCSQPPLPPAHAQRPISFPGTQVVAAAPDILAPAGPKWFQWEYWKERFFDRDCCLPRKSSQRQGAGGHRQPIIDYRPSYLGRYDDDDNRNNSIYLHSTNYKSMAPTYPPWGLGGPLNRRQRLQRQQQQQPQPYYVMPWPPPQVSPLTDAGRSFVFSSPPPTASTTEATTQPHNHHHPHHQANAQFLPSSQLLLANGTSDRIVPMRTTATTTLGSISAGAPNPRAIQVAAKMTSGVAPSAEDYIGPSMEANKQKPITTTDTNSGPSNRTGNAGRCQSNKKKRHHRKSSSLLGTNYELPPGAVLGGPVVTMMEESDKTVRNGEEVARQRTRKSGAATDDDDDALSVSSLEVHDNGFHNQWQTPLDKQSQKAVVPPDTTTTEGTHQSNATTSTAVSSTLVSPNTNSATTRKNNNNSSSPITSSRRPPSPRSSSRNSVSSPRPPRMGQGSSGNGSNSSNHKPPVPPPRRSSSSAGGGGGGGGGGGNTIMISSRHKSQMTNSTMASTALPPLPSPPPPPSPAMTTTSSMTTPPSLSSPISNRSNVIPIIMTPTGRDLTRSFSEASANTTGSRHRRGGTVCEFSFESLSNLNNTKEILGMDDRPPRSSIRSSSLPLEVQIHVPTTGTPIIAGNSMFSSPYPERRRRLSSSSSIGMYDSRDSGDIAPTQSHFLGEMEGGTPDGYFSPLESEEEQFTSLHPPTTTLMCASLSSSSSSSSPGDGTRGANKTKTSTTATSPREVASCSYSTTNSEAYAADIDSPQTTTTPNSSGSCSSSNPQDSSLCGGDENNPHLINFEEKTPCPLDKFKDPPTIPVGESWMWSWVNNNNNNRSTKKNNDDGRKTSAGTEEAKAVTPTQSASSTSSEILDNEKTPHPSITRTEYLPKCPPMEQSWRKKYAEATQEGIALSGWVAFGLGDALVKKAIEEGKSLERSDVAYVMLANGSEKLWFSNSSMTNDDENDNNKDGGMSILFDSIDLRGCHVEVHEISREHGRAIYLKRGTTTIGTILPVCLPEQYSGDRIAFGDGSICFPKGDYLPDDQQYTTMHVMFALDALLKAKQQSF